MPGVREKYITVCAACGHPDSDHVQHNATARLRGTTPGAEHPAGWDYMQPPAGSRDIQMHKHQCFLGRGHDGTGAVSASGGACFVVLRLHPPCAVTGVRRG